MGHYGQYWNFEFLHILASELKVDQSKSQNKANFAFNMYFLGLK